MAWLSASILAVVHRRQCTRLFGETMPLRATESCSTPPAARSEGLLPYLITLVRRQIGGLLNEDFSGADDFLTHQTPAVH